MRPCLRRIAAASAAAYLLAGWLAAALHSHGGHHHASEAEPVCTTCSCGHDHGPAKDSSEEKHTPVEPTCPEGEHHHCVVCDFLAKPPAAAEAVSLVATVEPVVSIAEPIAPVIEPAEILLLRSRGPPVA